MTNKETKNVKENVIDKEESIENIEEEIVGEEDVAEQEKTSEQNEDDSKNEAQANEKKAEDEDLNTRYMRLMADFQNYKKRAEKQRSEIHAYANEKIVIKLIDVLDNFERALQNSEGNGEGEDRDGAVGFKEGMTLIFKQLKDTLTDAGVTEIEAEDVVFDPNYHNAVMMEDTDKVKSGNVSEVLQKGYMLNGKVIRPSMVKVAN